MITSLSALPIDADQRRTPIEAVRSLARENDELVARLRNTQIPQHVGMATACQALAVELPAMLVATIEAELRSGALAKRWQAVRAAADESCAGGGVEPTMASIAALLRDQSRVVMRHLAARGKEWTADAYRLEGQAAAFEGQAERLRRAIGPTARAELSVTNRAVNGRTASEGDDNDRAATAAAG